MAFHTGWCFPKICTELFAQHTQIIGFVVLEPIIFREHSFVGALAYYLIVAPLDLDNTVNMSAKRACDPNRYMYYIALWSCFVPLGLHPSS